MDAASRGRSRCRGEEAVGPNSGCKREGQVERGPDWQAQNGWPIALVSVEASIRAGVKMIAAANALVVRPHDEVP